MHYLKRVSFSYNHTFLQAMLSSKLWYLPDVHVGHLSKCQGVESVRLDTMTGLAGHLPLGTVHVSQNLSPVPFDGSLIQRFRCLCFFVAVKVTANMSYLHWCVLSCSLLAWRVCNHPGHAGDIPLWGLFGLQLWPFQDHYLIYSRSL